MSPAEIAGLVLGVVVLFAAARGGGYLASRLGLPKVIGEILGGLVLGPTVLARLVTTELRWPFSVSGDLNPLFTVIYEFGLLLLMYISGAEVRASFSRRERKSVTSITLGGSIIPFAAGLYCATLLNPRDFEGAAGSRWSFLIIVGVATAVTSIPVISRIMLDLGILKTAFARVVLAAAIVEDVLLYTVLAVAIGLAGGAGADEFGLADILNLPPGALTTGYHVVMTAVLFAGGLTIVRRLYQRVVEWRNRVGKAEQPALQIVLLLLMASLSSLIGVESIFGGLIAGLIAGSTGEEHTRRSRESIKRFGMATFIPAYFALVGSRLDLIHEFAPLFFVGFLVFACGVKTLGVYFGARAGGERPPRAVNFAVAMNARGGPGIVVASVAFDAQIVNHQFFGVLVMLALVTSLMAGAWLQRSLRTNPELFLEEAPTPTA